jgi:peptide chain release factor 1
MIRLQHVNRTESAVRLTHLPTGITVSMQDTRSQHKNRVKAFQILRARLLALQIAEAQANSRAQRRAQVRGTDRSEKIRTYNVAQDRVTDHRLPLTINGVQGFLDGDDDSLGTMLGELAKWTQRQQLDDLLDGTA